MSGARPSPSSEPSTLLRAHGDSVLALAVAPCARGQSPLLASGGEDRLVHLWSLAALRGALLPPAAAAAAKPRPRPRPRPLRALCGAAEPVAALAFGRVDGDDSLGLQLYSANGSRILVYEVGLGLYCDGDGDGDRDDGAAAGGAAATAEAQPPSFTIEVNTDEVAALAVHPTQTLLAAADDSGSIAIISTVTRRLLRVLRGGGHSSLCSCASFLPLPLVVRGGGGAGGGGAAKGPGAAAEDALLVSGGMDHALICWNASRGAVRGSLVVAAAISAVEDAAGAAAELAAATGIPPTPPTMSQEQQLLLPAPPRAMNPPFVHSLAMSPCGSFLACALGDGTVAVCDWDRAGRGARAPRPLWWARVFPSAATCVGFVRHCLRGEAAGSAPSFALPAGESMPSETEEFLFAAGNDGRILGWAWADIVAAVVRRLDAGPGAQVPHAVSPTFRLRHGRGPSMVVAATLQGPCGACAALGVGAGACGGKGLLLVCCVSKRVTAYEVELRAPPLGPGAEANLAADAAQRAAAASSTLVDSR